MHLSLNLSIIKVIISSSQNLLSPSFYLTEWQYCRPFAQTKNKSIIFGSFFFSLYSQSNHLQDLLILPEPLSPRHPFLYSVAILLVQTTVNCFLGHCSYFIYFQILFLSVSFTVLQLHIFFSSTNLNKSFHVKKRHFLFLTALKVKSKLQLKRSFMTCSCFHLQPFISDSYASATLNYILSVSLSPTFTSSFPLTLPLSFSLSPSAFFKALLCACNVPL